MKNEMSVKTNEPTLPTSRYTLQWKNKFDFFNFNIWLIEWRPNVMESICTCPMRHCSAIQFERVYSLGRWTMPHACQTVHSLMSININYITQLAFIWRGGNEWSWTWLCVACVCLCQETSASSRDRHLQSRENDSVFIYWRLFIVILNLPNAQHISILVFIHVRRVRQPECGGHLLSII